MTTRPLAEGIMLQPETLVEVQANVLAENAVRMAQLEAAIQQLTRRNEYLEGRLAESEDVDANPIE